MAHPHKCGFLNLGRCYNRIVDTYDLNDPKAWQNFISAGFVLKAREKK